MFCQVLYTIYTEKCGANYDLDSWIISDAGVDANANADFDNAWVSYMIDLGESIKWISKIAFKKTLDLEPFVSKLTTKSANIKDYHN